MKIRLQCPQCDDEHFLDDEPAELAFYPLDLSDDGVIELNCESGHATTICLRQERFELLSEVAANAIVDGYYREAVATFKAALERFYEFYLEVICSKWHVGPKTFEATWGVVRRQSERQFGAFAFVYLLLNSMKPPTMPDHLDKLRNDVIHNGKIPTREEALEFGQAIIDVMKDPLQQLNERRNAKALQAIRSRNFRRTFETIKTRRNPATLYVSTAIRLASAGDQVPLAKTVEEIERSGRQLSARLVN